MFPFRVAVALERPVHALQQAFQDDDIEEVEEIDGDAIEEIEPDEE